MDKGLDTMSDARFETLQYAVHVSPRELRKQCRDRRRRTARGGPGAQERRCARQFLRQRGLAVFDRKAGVHGGQEAAVEESRDGL